MTVPQWISTGWGMAKRAPSLATVLAIALAYFLIWYAYNGGLAKADELATLKEEVSELKTDVGELTNDVKEGRLDTLEGQLFEARVAQCAAEGVELRRLYAERVAKLQATYAAAGGDRFDLPDCGDL